MNRKREEFFQRAASLGVAGGCLCLPFVREGKAKKNLTVLDRGGVYTECSKKVAGRCTS